MVDRYWRKIESIENDIESSMQISSILLKLKGYDEKLGDLSKIGNNENNISSNLGKIDINKNNISSNLEIINTNKNNISSNLEIINTNRNNISSNLEKISNNKTNISSNLNQINDIKSILPMLEISKKTYSIKNQSMKFNSNIIYFRLLENRYYGDSSCLSYLKKEIRNSIMPKNIKDIDIINRHRIILNYLCKKIMLIVIF